MAKGLAPVTSHRSLAPSSVSRGTAWEWVKRIIDEVEPIRDEIYGPRYRCALTLKDGTFLPCAVLQSKERLIALAKRRITEEMNGRGVFRGGDDPYGRIVGTFVAERNRVSDDDVATAAPSKFALPLSLLSQIRGETTMGWTGWVFRMKDGRAFSFGSTFLMEFFHLPDGYDFSDVEEVINHSFVSDEGVITSLRQGGAPPMSYFSSALFRERTFFSCAVEGV